MTRHRRHRLARLERLLHQRDLLLRAEAPTPLAGRDNLHPLRRYGTSTDSGTSASHFPRHRRFTSATALLSALNAPTQEGPQGNAYSLPIPRTTTLLNSRGHSAELDTATQNSQSPALKLTVENASCRKGV